MSPCVFVDYGDNLLGALLASSLRGFYLFPSPNLKENPPVPLTLRAHAELYEADIAAPSNCGRNCPLTLLGGTDVTTAGVEGTAGQDWSSSPALHVS